MTGRRISMWRTDEADQASRLAWRTVALHEARSLDSLVSGAGLEIDEVSLALEGITEIVTVCEIATTESLLALANRIIGDAAQPVRAVAWTSAQQGAEGTWQSRREFAKQWLGLAWGDEPWFRAWLGFVEARNAWAHGHGTLTRKQLARQDLDRLLASAGLSRSGHHVVASRGDVRGCAHAAHQLLTAIDDALAARADATSKVT